MLPTNQKGAIAETKIAAAATELGICVLRPIAEHGRYDLAFEVGDRIARVQVQVGRLGQGTPRDTGLPPQRLVDARWIRVFPV